MPMDMLAFQSAVVELDQGLGKIREELGTALKKDNMPKAERRAALEAGQRKLAEYDALMAKVSEGWRRMAHDTVGEEMDKVRERVAQLKEKLA